MLLNARRNSFLFLFPPSFFAEHIKQKYKDTYMKALILPYDNVDDYMSSTIQEINFPGFNMDPVKQTRKYGKEQEMKNSRPVEDLYPRRFTLKFQISDGFLNYFIFSENAIHFMDLKNPNMYHPVFKLGLINNEGNLVAHVDFKMVSLLSQSEFVLSQAAAAQEFNTFTAEFLYNDFDFYLDYGTREY